MAKPRISTKPNGLVFRNQSSAAGGNRWRLRNIRRSKKQRTQTGLLANNSSRIAKRLSLFAFQWGFVALPKAGIA